VLDSRRPLKKNALAVLRKAKRRAKAQAVDVVKPLSKLPGAPSFVYGLASDAFTREHNAVFAGRERYQQLVTKGGQRYLLRRNTHMLEKGLIMKPRREVFALDYIGVTVDCYNSLVGETDIDAAELQWAHDVLAQYFEVTADHPTIEAARSRFEQGVMGTDERSTSPGLSPYARDLNAPLTVSYDNLLKLAQHRRSVRWFSDQKVDRALLDKAMTIAGLSPSACNRQPFEFRIFDDPELVQEVAKIPMGTRGYVHNIPVFIVIVGDLSAFFSERDRHLIYTDGCLAAMSFLFALETLGVSTCCVNWPDIKEFEEAMAQRLSLRPDQRPVMCIAAGYPDPDGMVPFSQKKSLRELRRYNFE
jgi:nitroreductase